MPITRVDRNPAHELFTLFSVNLPGYIAHQEASLASISSVWEDSWISKLTMNHESGAPHRMATFFNIKGGKNTVSALETVIKTILDEKNTEKLKKEIDFPNHMLHNIA